MPPRPLSASERERLERQGSSQTDRRSPVGRWDQLANHGYETGIDRASTSEFETGLRPRHAANARGSVHGPSGTGRFGPARWASLAAMALGAALLIRWIFRTVTG